MNSKHNQWHIVERDKDGKLLGWFGYDDHDKAINTVVEFSKVKGYKGREWFTIPFDCFITLLNCSVDRCMMDSIQRTIADQAEYYKRLETVGRYLIYCHSNDLDPKDLTSFKKLYDKGIRV